MTSMLFCLLEALLSRCFFSPTISYIAYTSVLFCFVLFYIYIVSCPMAFILFYFFAQSEVKKGEQEVLLTEYHNPLSFFL